MAANIDCYQLPCGATCVGCWPARTPFQRPTSLPASRHKQLHGIAAKYAFRTCPSRRRSASSSNSHQSSDAAPKSEQSTATADALSQEHAWQLLQEFTRLNARGMDQSMLDSPSKRARLRQASLEGDYFTPGSHSCLPLPGSRVMGPESSIETARVSMQVAAGSTWPAAGWDPASQPSSILLGIVSSDVRLAMRSLRDYLAVLHLPFVAPASRVVGIKSAAAVRGPCFVKYTAATEMCYVSQYSGEDRGVLIQFGQQQVGHLPLGLFDPDVSRE